MMFDGNCWNWAISTTKTLFLLKLYVYLDQYRIILIIFNELRSKYQKDTRKPTILLIILSVMIEVLWKFLELSYFNDRESLLLNLYVYFDKYRIISIIFEEIFSKYRNDPWKPPISWKILSIINDVRCKIGWIELYRRPRLLFFKTFLYFDQYRIMSIIFKEIGSNNLNDTRKP